MTSTKSQEQLIEIKQVLIPAIVDVVITTKHLLQVNRGSAQEYNDRNHLINALTNLLDILIEAQG